MTKQDDENLIIANENEAIENNKQELNLAIVGHTNVGKTSLMRTLMKDSKFGVVSNKAGETREVIIYQKQINDIRLALFDTPGLEEASSLQDYIDVLTDFNMRLNDKQRLESFLNSSEAASKTGRFAQEAKVFKQLLASDAGLYVIDTREPVLAKYKDEIALLRGSTRPLLAVFNFTNDKNSHLDLWLEALTNELHIFNNIELDAFNPEKGEENLYNSLSLLLAHNKEKSEIAKQIYLQIQLDNKQKFKAALNILSDLLIDCVAYKIYADDENIELNLMLMKKEISQREQKTIDELLDLYNFPKNSNLQQNLPFTNGRFDDDLFSMQALKDFSISFGKSFATGAGLGAGIDLMFGGLTLGVASLIGGVLGALTSTVKNYTNKIKYSLSSEKAISLPDELLQVLLKRNFALIEALKNQGHANSEFNLELFNKQFNLNLSNEVLSLRSSYNLSSLNKNSKVDRNEKQEQIDIISKELLEQINKK